MNAGSRGRAPPPVCSHSAMPGKAARRARVQTMSVTGSEAFPYLPGPLEIETRSPGALGCLGDGEDELNPQPRDRCNTWPLQRPNGST